MVQTATTKQPAAATPTTKSTGIDKKKCVTHEFRVSFPAVFQPKSFQNQEAKYSVVMLFPKNVDLAKPANGQKNSLKHAAFNAAAEKWGADKAKWPKNLRMPFRDGDEKADTQGYEGHVFVSASSKIQPGLVDQSLRPMLNERDFYAGCYARAEVIAFAYDQMGNRGVGFSLQNIQKLRDGDPFSGRKDPSTVFDAVEDSSEDQDSYEGGEDSTEDGLGF